MEKCTKVKFDSMREARTKANNVNRTNNKNGDKTRRYAYKCPKCNSYHTTRTRPSDFKSEHNKGLNIPATGSSQLFKSLKEKLLNCYGMNFSRRHLKAELWNYKWRDMGAVDKIKFAFENTEEFVKYLKEKKK